MQEQQEKDKTMLNRIIFLPPSESSYTALSFPGELCVLLPNETEQENEQESKNEKYIPIVALAVEQKGSRCVLLFLHGNASDIGQNHAFLERLRDACQVNVVAVEYPGYGLYRSYETPSEVALFARTLKAFDSIVSQETVDAIVLVGYSLGSTAACEIAHKRRSHPKLKGVVLLSPFASVHDLIRDLTSHNFNPYIAAGLKRLIPNSHFPNQESIKAVPVPILVIHGSADEIIPVRHAHRLALAAPDARLVIVANMKHDINAPQFEPLVLNHVSNHLRFVHNNHHHPNRNLFPKAWYEVTRNFVYIQPKQIIMIKNRNQWLLVLLCAILGVFIARRYYYLHKRVTRGFRPRKPRLLGSTTRRRIMK